MRVVLDTNVLLAAFGTRGLCEAVFQVCLERHEIILSRHILNEVHINLTTKFKVPAAHTRQIATFLRQHARTVQPADVSPDACRDSDDLPVLGTAQAAKAHVLITGDKDLLELKKFETTIILTPRQFYDQIK
jgi:uncharacterized protein